MGPPALFDMGTLDVACVHFDVSGAALLRGGDSVCVVSRLMMSDDTGDGDWFPVSTAERSRTGGHFGCPKFTFYRISFHIDSVIFFKFLTKCLPPRPFLDRTTGSGRNSLGII